jgi:2-(1,2-epoxy-1,2-dihydrophenyl)acetyl-CoA isomerase
MLRPYPALDSVKIDLSDGLLSLRINDPGRRNALDDDGIRALNDALETAHNDEKVRAVVLSGEGDNFCSGFDIVRRNADPDNRPRVGAIQRRLPSQAHRLIPQLCALQVPVVAAVTGYAVGIGMQLALASDFVVADETWLVTRAVGPLRARRLLLLGERLDAGTAREWGIVHEVVPAGEAGSAAHALASRLASGPTVALGLTKALINQAADQRLDDQLRAEGFALELSSRSKDFREGLTAFVQKRPPQFSGM